MKVVYLLLLFMIIMWAFSFVLVDVAVEIIPPLSVALYRYIIASASFLVLDIYNKLKPKKISNIGDAVALKEEYKFSKIDWEIIVISSFVAVSIFFLVQYTAIELIGPSLPALFVCLLSPLLISILAIKFFKEKLNKLKTFGFIVATIGAFLLVTGGDIRNLMPDSPNFLGYLLAILTSILWAIYTIISKNIIKSKPNLKTIIKTLEYISYLGTIELLFLVLISNEFTLFINNFFNLPLFLIEVYLGPGCYVLGYWIWQKAQVKLSSSSASSFLYIEPFFTLLFSFLLQRSEVIVLWNIIGGIIVLFAVILINYK